MCVEKYDFFTLCYFCYEQLYFETEILFINAVFEYTETDKCCSFILTLSCQD